ncbi:MAG TPA: glycosyltransferase family 4 protein [Thermoflexus sp.]|nr:glycosyltransferase family 4 protein [Thermoflexus sp.]
MRILMLTQVLPYPLVSGPQIKTYYVLRYLSQRHSITLVSLVRGSERKDWVEALRPFCETIYTVRLPRSRARDAWALARAACRGEPFLIARDHVPALYALLRRLKKEGRFDAVHADQLNMAPYALTMSAYRVLDAHNAVWRIAERLAQTVSAGWARALALWEARRLKAYEGHVSRVFDQVLTVSEEDRRALEEAAGGPLPGATIPIALGPEDFPPIPRDPDAKGVLHIGGLHWPPNAEGIRWFCREVWPRVRAAVSEARLFLIGARPPRDLQAMADRDPSIVVPGFVADPTPYWRQSAVLIVPVHAGSGVRVKILEAWSRGMPVVSTSIGCEGLRAHHGENLWVADSAEAFAAAILNLLQDPDLARRIAEGGRRTLQEHYDYRHALKPLEQVYG